MESARTGKPRGALYLIPNLLGETSIDSSLPPLAARVVRGLSHFLAEDEKSARRLIKLLAPDVNLRELQIRRLDEHTALSEVAGLLSPLSEGVDVGVISEAGLPAVADPGSSAVRHAHAIGAQVKPLVGPCSMMLALMSSGLNGQRWRFVGYLPIEEQARREAILDMEREVSRHAETQIFMDTPYRNQRLLEELIKVCRPDTLLCVAQELTTGRELIRVQPISAWKQSKPISKAPALFLLGS